MRLSNLIKPTKQNQYLAYLLNQHSIYVTTPYMNIFMGRESNLDILLNDEFQEVKLGVDREITRIGLLLDSLDMDNLDVKSLNQLGEKISELTAYMNHIKDNKDKWEKK